jgi:hypothetical protein
VIWSSRWRRVYGVIIAFYLFDFISTFLYCSSPDEEGGFFPHLFMELTNSVFFGLTLNIVTWGAFWALVLFKFLPWMLRKYKVNLLKNTKENLAQKYLQVLEIFAAATSWYWQIPDFIRSFIGLAMYLVSLIWVKPFSEP